MAGAVGTGDELALAICEALGLDAKMTRRIILDFPCSGPIRAYVEMYASEKILTIDWAAGLSCAEIRVSDEV